MHESYFDWDAGNEDHVLAHEVSPAEAEEALLDPEGLQADARNAPDERRFAFIGSTEEGRVLFVVYAEREGASDHGPGRKRRSEA